MADEHSLDPDGPDMGAIRVEIRKTVAFNRAHGRLTTDLDIVAANPTRYHRDMARKDCSRIHRSATFLFLSSHQPLQ